MISVIFALIKRLQFTIFTLCFFCYTLYSNLELADKDLVLLMITDDCENEENLNFPEVIDQHIDQ